MKNGSILLVEPAMKAKSITVHLFASARGVDESKGSGLRHLLEHLSVKGADGALDERLESKGCFLRAETMRDAMDIEISLPPGKLEVGLAALKEILGVHDFDATGIKREVGIIKEEIALRDDAGSLAAEGWKLVYGGSGEDPIGDAATLDSATAEEVSKVCKATFASANLALVIEGPVTLNDATDAGKALLAALPASHADLKHERSPLAVAPTRGEANATGEARCLAVPGIGDSRCAASLCAALALASEVKDAFVTYTPSLDAGLVTVGVTDSVGRLSHLVDGLDAAGIDALYGRGLRLAWSWSLRQIATPEASAYVRGLLLVQDPLAKFEVLQERIAKVTSAEFRTAVIGFRTRAATVVGTQ